MLASNFHKVQEYKELQIKYAKKLIHILIKVS